jgi:hypothetical protein
MMLDLPWETRWPQPKDGDYNGLCSTSIHFPLLGSHLNPFTSTTLALGICQLHNFNHSTDYLVVTIYFLSFLDNKIWSIYLVYYSNGLCIVCIVPIVFYSLYRSVYNLVSSIAHDHSKIYFLIRSLLELNWKDEMENQVTMILLSAADLITILLVADFDATESFH